MRKSEDLNFLIVLIVGISLFFLTLSFKAEDNGESGSAPGFIKNFPEMVLDARAAYVYDVRTKEVLFAKNSETRMPLASLTKLMAALVAKEITPEYGTIVVGQEAIRAEGDSGLKPSERWTLKDLLDFSLVSSSNDGMRAIALSLGGLSISDARPEEVINDFVRKMNEEALRLDLKNTYFWNETGLDESEVKGGAYGTAKDVTRLMEYIVTTHPELLEATRSREVEISSLDGFKHVAKNTNDLVPWIPGFLGSKTGYTATAGGNLTLAFDPELGRPIIVTVMGSSEQGRFEDAKKLINATLEYINQ